MVRFLVLDCRSFVVKVDRTYRLSGGPGDFRPARGQGYEVWAIGSRKSTLSCLIRALNNGHKILLGVKTLQKLLGLQIAAAPQSQHYN